MKRHSTAALYGSVLALWGCFCLGADRAQDGTTQPGVEALTRGPIHEAFAQPLDLDEEAPIVIGQEPPDPIEEIPPDEKPEGDNVVWIAGYWQWDNELNDFIWVSGCWRAVPPGTAWVPGYWRETNQGYEWIAGFWKNADTRKIAYQTPPPETLERGPTSYAPADDRIWVPGCWVWQSSFWHSGRYAWRPGFWLAARTDWVWVPAHYVYTPHGYIFVEGYWDYALERRGAVFLPVYCSPEARVRVSFVFSPYLVFDVSFLTRNLFCSPRRHHYYYGDYYGDRYFADGYRPWFEPSRRSRCYEPIFSYAQWHHRDDRGWANRQRSDYEYRRDHDDARPPRTYRSMEDHDRRRSGSQGRESRVARPLAEVVRDADSKVRYERVSPTRREEDRSRGRQLGDYREERSQWETPADETRRPVGERDSADTTRRPVGERGSADTTRRSVGDRDSADRYRQPVTPPTQVQMVPPVRESTDQTKTLPQSSERREGSRDSGNRDRRTVTPSTEGRMAPPVQESDDRTSTPRQSGERQDRSRGNDSRGSSTVTPPTQGRVIVVSPGESPAPTRSLPQPTERRDATRPSGGNPQPVVTPAPETRVTVTPRQGDSGGERQTTRSAERVEPRTVRVPVSPITVERRSRTESATPPATPKPPKADPNATRTEGSGSTSSSDDSRGSRSSERDRRNR